MVTIKKSTLIWVFAVLAAAAVTVAKHNIAESRKSAMGDMSKKVEQKILSFELANYAADGKKKWLLKGDSADILAEIVNLSHIDMETYDEPKITVTARKGDYDRNNKEISLYEDVVVVTSDGARLTTDYLKWHGDTDTITTDKPVRIIRSDVIADGKGASAMPQMKKMILNKDVVVKLARSMIKDMDAGFDLGKGGKDETLAAPDRPTKATITCDGPLEIDYEKNIAVFNDDVLVDDAKGRIYSDRMEAFLDPQTKNIVKVVAEGDVKVVRDGDSTHSQKAIYTTEDQKIILVGSPKIYIEAPEEVEKIEDEMEGL